MTAVRLSNRPSFWSHYWQLLWFLAPLIPSVTPWIASFNFNLFLSFLRVLQVILTLHPLHVLLSVVWCQWCYCLVFLCVVCRLTFNYWFYSHTQQGFHRIYFYLCLYLPASRSHPWVALECTRPSPSCLPPSALPMRRGARRGKARRGKARQSEESCNRVNE